MRMISYAALHERCPVVVAPRLGLGLTA